MIEDIKKAQSNLEVARNAYLDSLARATTGMRVFENSEMSENEVAIVCGSKVYKALQERIKADNPQP